MYAFRIAAFVMYSIAPNTTFCFVFPLFCVIVTLSLVFVSPYKQLYQKYNKLDFVMILSLGIVINAYFFPLYWCLPKAPLLSYWLHCFLIFSLSPLVYFTVRLCLSMKCVLVQKLSISHHVSSNRLEEDYKNYHFTQLMYVKLCVLITDFLHGLNLVAVLYMLNSNNVWSIYL